MSAGAPATGIWFLPDRPAGELVDAIVHAERRGIDEVWLGDEGPAREPFTVLAMAAARTERIRLAVGVTNPYVRHPGVAVSSAATIAEAAGPRVVLGVGAGGAMSLAPFRLEAERPRDAVAAFIEIARAMRRGEPVDGYEPSDLAVSPTAPAVPVFVGARGPLLNRLASEAADGAFVAGMPPVRFDEVVGWARSVRPIDVALYPSAALDEAGRERHRPEMIWSLLDAPPATAARLGVDPSAVARAAAALRSGDAAPAAALVDDELLEQLMLVGTPAAVGARLADLVAEHRPSSIGMAVVGDDLVATIDLAADAFVAMRTRSGVTA